MGKKIKKIEIKKTGATKNKNIKHNKAGFPDWNFPFVPWLFNFTADSCDYGALAGCNNMISRYGDEAETENSPSMPQLLLQTPLQKRHASGWF